MIRRSIVLIALVLVPASAAQAVPLRSGTVTISGKPLPVRSGTLENGEGILHLRGKLTVAGRVLRALHVDLRDRGVVTARVDGLRQPVFSVRTHEARVGSAPTPIRIRGVRLRATGALRGGEGASLSVKAVPRYLEVAGGQTTLAFAEGFSAALSDGGVTPGANEGAVIDDAGRAQFPVSRGRVLLGRKGGGKVDHGGGLSFSRENVVALRMNDFKLVPAREGILYARVDDSSQRVRIATVALEPPTFEGDSALIADSAATLTAEGAEAFNGALGTSLAAGDAFGLVAVAAVIQ